MGFNFKRGIKRHLLTYCRRNGNPTAVLTKAIKVAHKGEFGKHRDDFDTLKLFCIV